MRSIFALAVLTATLAYTTAQNNLNSRADSILGVYRGEQRGDVFKARITKQPDGCYRGQIFWLERDRDSRGNKLLDVKNPDKNLRSTPRDQVVLFEELRYNPQKQRWDGTKIYDPQRGFKANLTAEFTKEGELRLTGTVMGMSGHFVWKKIE
ncbi:MAG: DUF2147 domain-containing protein [Bacteroidales bacterium]|nr:DUF2147 domain-containing protein [Bacteroidales bacterium]